MTPPPSQSWRLRKSSVSPAELRARGVLEVGRASGTSVLYVRTPGRVYLFHAESLVDRVLDAYAVELAVGWLDWGATSTEVASNLGVSVTTLRSALLAAGYERVGGLPSGRARGSALDAPVRRRGRLVYRGPAVRSGGDP